MAAAAPKRSASDALKESHGVQPTEAEAKATADAAAAAEKLAEPGAPLAPSEESSLTAEQIEAANKAAADKAAAEAKAIADASDADHEVVDGGTVSVIVKSSIAMVMDGKTHRTFRRGAKLKVTKAVAERGIRLGSFDK